MDNSWLGTGALSPLGRYYVFMSEYSQDPVPSEAPAFCAWDGQTWYFNKRAGYHYNRDGFLLHRAVWIGAHGPIPDGHEIHHINRKRWDSRLVNLELLTVHEHRVRTQRERTDKAEQSKRSSEQCSRGLRKMWSERQPRALNCAFCGVGFESTGMRAKYCSANCRVKGLKKYGADARNRRNQGERPR